jgi:hypothetical protein
VLPVGELDEVRPDVSGVGLRRVTGCDEHLDVEETAQELAAG